MNSSPYEDLGDQTLLVDCVLYRPQLAGCYLVRSGRELALIDCGTWHSVPGILAAIRAQGLEPAAVRWIIPTHVHLDHAGGAGRLMQVCENATLVAHPRGVPHLVDPGKLQAGATAVYGEEAFARDFGTLDPIAAERCIAADDAQTFDLGNRTLHFLHTPGHANHHGCIFDASSGNLFTGDTFGLAYRELSQRSPFVVATTTPVAFDPDAWLQSLERMLAMNPGAVCLTHYGSYRNPQSLAPMLRSSIQAHVEIALEEEGNTVEGRQQRLESALQELMVTQAAAHAGVSASRAKEILAGDIVLNAQGLAVWLARRAKRRDT